VEYERANPRVNAVPVHLQNDNEMVASGQHLAYRALEPGARVGEQDSVACAAAPVQAGEAIPGLRGELPAGICVSFCQHADADALCAAH
jgi:hypothetical protein